MTGKDKKQTVCVYTDQQGKVFLAIEDLVLLLEEKEKEMRESEANPPWPAPGFAEACGGAAAALKGLKQAFQGILAGLDAENTGHALTTNKRKEEMI